MLLHFDGVGKLNFFGAGISGWRWKQARYVQCTLAES